MAGKVSKKSISEKENKDPAVLFYTSDFLTGTMLMTDEQVGKYIRLLCFQHQNGRLNKKHMLSICKAYDEDVFLKFKEDDDGLFYNHRMEKESNKRSFYTQSRRKNASGNLKNKGMNDDEKNSLEFFEKHMPKHMENENENENINEDENRNGNGIKKPACVRFKNPPIDENEDEEEFLESDSFFDSDSDDDETHFETADVFNYFFNKSKGRMNSNTFCEIDDFLKKGLSSEVVKNIFDICKSENIREWETVKLRLDDEIEKLRGEKP